MFSSSVFKVINGVSVDTYNGNLAAYQMTLQQAVASSMTGVAYNEVVNMVATSAPAPSSRTALSHLRAFNLLRPLSGDAIQVTYTVSTTSALSQAQLEAQLSDSVSTGNFNTLMHAYAATNGAVALETATSSSITITSADDGSDNSKKLSTAELVGVIVGSAVGFLLLAGLAYYFCARKKGLLNQPGVEL